MTGTILATVAVAIVVAYEIWTAFGWLQELRHQRMESHAKKLGRPFAPILRDLAWLFQPALPLFETGQRPDFINAIDFSQDGRKRWLFDLAYTVGRGRTSRRYFTTAYASTLSSAALPIFSLQPRRFFHVIIDALANDVIEFDEFPELSRHYLLRGSDPEAVRRLLHAGLAASVTSGPPIYHLECADSLAIFYRAERRVRLEELAEFVRSAESYFALLEEAGPLLAMEATSSLS